MQTVEEFMREYFEAYSKLVSTQNKIAQKFQEKFFGNIYFTMKQKEYELNYTYRKIFSPEILIIEAEDDSAKVIVSESFGYYPERRRYDLLATDNGWRIYRNGSECFSCKGEGESYGEVCDYCNGEKWRFSGPTVGLK